MNYDRIVQPRHRIIISGRKNIRSIITAEELLTIIVHYEIHVRFNFRDFYFRDANGTSLKVGPHRLYR